jgi:hypothetical protein
MEKIKVESNFMMNAIMTLQKLVVHKMWNHHLQ